MVEPAKNFKFTASRGVLAFAGGDSSSLDSNVYGGMAKSAFRTLGQRLVADLAGIAPPKVKVLSPAEEIQQRCEGAGDAKACARFGRTLADPKSKSYDHVRAIMALTKACSYGRACADLAWLHLKNGGDMARAKAVTALMDGCRDRDAEACRLWAEIKLVSDEVKTYLGRPPSKFVTAQSLRLMVKGCDLVSGRACGRAAALYLDSRNERKDPWIALIFARRGCTARDRLACGLIKKLTVGTGRAKSTRSVLGEQLPAGARLYDVRYRVHYESVPALEYWVALAKGQLRVALSKGGIMQHVFAVADPKRPTTVKPPSGTKQVARLTPWSKGRKCKPCYLGPLGTAQFGCDCSVH